jgi:hypothetical protein
MYDWALAAPERAMEKIKTAKKERFIGQAFREGYIFRKVVN